jgi:hypothetical protein
MTTRKTYMAGVLLAALVLTAGCSGLLGEDQSFEAGNISVSDAALSDTGYEVADQEEYTLSEDVVNDTEVNITSRLTSYERSYGALSGHVVALATPKSEVAGVDVNLLGELDRSELVARALSRSGEVDVDVDDSELETVNNTETAVLDTDANVTTYATTVTQSGQDIDVLIHATRIEHDDDYVIGVGVQPASADGAESDIIAMFEGIEHGE